MLLLLAATAGVLVFKGRVEDLGDNGVLRSDCPPQADCLGDAAPPRRPSPAECPPPQADFLPQGILPMFQADTCINSEEDVHPLTPRMASEVELVARDECKGLMLALQGSFRLHRKLWEFCAILKAFRVLSDQPKSALVFAVGTEPLPAFFAHLGVDVLATDAPLDEGIDEDWGQSGQHASNVDALARNESAALPDLADLTTLRQRVKFMPVDMNALPFGELKERGHDFIWSTCAVEHIGSVTLGQTFVLNSLRFLRPGGVAIHTVELSLSSNAVALRLPGNSVWRRQDVEDVFGAARHLGYEVMEPCFGTGDGKLDRVPDTQPYSSDRHIKLVIDSHVCTSFAMVFRKRLTPRARIAMRSSGSGQSSRPDTTLAT